MLQLRDPELELFEVRARDEAELLEETVEPGAGSFAEADRLAAPAVRSSPRPPRAPRRGGSPPVRESSSASAPRARRSARPRRSRPARAARATSRTSRRYRRGHAASHGVAAGAARASTVPTRAAGPVAAVDRRRELRDGRRGAGSVGRRGLGLSEHRLASQRCRRRSGASRLRRASTPARAPSGS